MFTKIKTVAHHEVLCAECVRMLDAGGISRQVLDWGEDVITPDMVRERVEVPTASRCTWCGPDSRWLSERMIALLTLKEREALMRRLLEHTRRAECGRNARGWEISDGPTPHHDRLLAMLGRLSALLA